MQSFNPPSLSSQTLTEPPRNGRTDDVKPSKPEDVAFVQTLIAQVCLCCQQPNRYSVKELSCCCGFKVVASKFQMIHGLPT